MKTTNIENKAEQMLKAIKGANSSLLTINEDIIEDALKAGIIKKVAEHTSRKGNHNIYYSIKNSKHDDMLMHVQNNMYVLISRYVYCFMTRELIDVIPYLLHFSFFVGRTSSNRCHVMAGCPKEIKRAYGLTSTIYLTRLLTSIKLYGEMVNLKSNYDVHHKGDCFDNRQYIIMYIPKYMHKHRNNHMTGRSISSYLELKKFMEYMNN